VNDRSIPITRRSALRTGGLAALAAGLLGSAGTGTAAAQPASAAPLVVGTTTNIDDLVAESLAHLARSNAACTAVDDVEEALKATLSPEQLALFTDYEHAAHHSEWAAEQMYVAELARHLPGLAPMVWAMWHHVIEGEIGVCCLPEDDDKA
jgi:hypothetical protein